MTEEQELAAAFEQLKAENPELIARIMNSPGPRIADDLPKLEPLPDLTEEQMEKIAAKIKLRKS